MEKKVRFGPRSVSIGTALLFTLFSHQRGEVLSKPNRFQVQLPAALVTSPFSVPRFQGFSEIVCLFPKFIAAGNNLTNTESESQKPLAHWPLSIREQTDWVRWVRAVRCPLWTLWHLASSLRILSPVPSQVLKLENLIRKQRQKISQVGPERWLHDQEPWLLFQRTHILLQLWQDSSQPSITMVWGPLLASKCTKQSCDTKTHRPAKHPYIHRFFKNKFKVPGGVTKPSDVPMEWKVHIWTLPQGVVFLTRLPPITWNFTEHGQYVNV